MELPSPFIFITAQNDAFDITVAYPLDDAANARRMWRRNTIEDDQVFHVVVVNDRDLGLKLDEYGFD